MEASVRCALWFRGSVHLSISAADIRKLPSERLPFLSSRALKLSLLVLERRRLLWMEPVWRGRDSNGWERDVPPGDAPVGVTGGDGEGRRSELLRQRSSSESPRPRTFLFDLLEQSRVSSETLQPLQFNSLFSRFIAKRKLVCLCACVSVPKHTQTLLGAIKELNTKLKTVIKLTDTQAYLRVH